MATVVFACKSNSCRSQMAEGWAKKWIEAERRKNSQIGEDERDDRLVAFLDQLVVVSVALDETSVMVSESVMADYPHCDLAGAPADGHSSASKEPDQSRRVSCDDFTCSPPPQLRKSVKEKAIRAMAEDGVDISNSVPKTITDVLPEILDTMDRREILRGSRHDKYFGEEKEKNNMSGKWERLRSYTGLLRNLLELTSKEMGMAYAGVKRKDISVAELSRHSALENASKNVLNENQVVDSLIVLCSCPDSLKRRVATLSKETLEWDISAPTSAAKSGEGDGAYLRVSRQIREKVNSFMNDLKETYLMDYESPSNSERNCARSCDKIHNLAPSPVIN